MNWSYWQHKLTVIKYKIYTYTSSEINNKHTLAARSNIHLCPKIQCWKIYLYINFTTLEIWREKNSSKVVLWSKPVFPCVCKRKCKPQMLTQWVKKAIRYKLGLQVTIFNWTAKILLYTSKQYLNFWTKRCALKLYCDATKHDPLHPQNIYLAICFESGLCVP